MEEGKANRKNELRIGNRKINDSVKGDRMNESQKKWRKESKIKRFTNCRKKRMKGKRKKTRCSKRNKKWRQKDMKRKKKKLKELKKKGQWIKWKKGRNNSPKRKNTVGKELMWKRQPKWRKVKNISERIQ